jgi:cytochrome c oxidase assembly protein subunit 15
VFVVCWTVFLLIAGALVTSNQAALSVPTWPGPLMPPMVGGAFYEHSHRIIGAVLGVLTIALAIVIWVKDKRPWMRRFGVIAVAGVTVQGILGGEVVRQLLKYWLPVWHACFAQILFAAVLGIAMFTSKWWLAEQPQIEDRGSPSVHSVALTNAILMFLQVFLGAGFRHAEISIWPHAVGALVVLGSVIATAAVLRRRYAQSREISFVRILLHAMLGMQLLLGLGAYWSRITTSPIPTSVMVVFTVAHTVLGALLFALSVFLVLLCYRLVPTGKPVAAARREAAA